MNKRRFQADDLHQLSTRKLRIPSSREFSDTVAHRLVTAPASLPHPQQCGMVSIDEIDDPHVGLGGVRPMQPSRVLAQRSLPRDRHGQDQRVQRGMVEAFADESPGREQDPRCVGWQRIKFGNQILTLPLRHPTVQYEGTQIVVLQRAPDAVEMIGALGQHQDLATVLDSALRLDGDCGGTLRILCQGAEDRLNAAVCWQLCRSAGRPRDDLEIVRSAGWRARGMSNRSALHEDDRLSTVSADRCCREPEDVASLDALEDGLERGCADMMALVYDHLTIVLDQRIDLAVA